MKSAKQLAARIVVCLSLHSREPVFGARGLYWPLKLRCGREDAEGRFWPLTKVLLLVNGKKVDEPCGWFPWRFRGNVAVFLLKGPGWLPLKRLWTRLSECKQVGASVPRERAPRRGRAPRFPPGPGLCVPRDNSSSMHVSFPRAPEGPRELSAE